MKKVKYSKQMLFFFMTTLVLVLISMFSVLIPRSYLENNIKEGFAKSRLILGDVGGNTYGFDSWRGNHQYQDCLILMQALHLSDDWKENAFLGPKSGLEKCDWLYNYVFKLKDKKELMSSVTNYPQYNHGVVAMTSILGSLFSLETLRALLKFVSVLLIGIIGLALFNISVKHKEIEGLKYGAIGTILVLLTLHGIDFFGQNLSHGLGDWVSLGFLATLLWALYKNYSLNRTILICIVFGCLSAYIEYFIGVLPFCLISIILFLAIKIIIDPNYTLKNGLKLLFAYGFSFVGIFLVFLIIKSVFIDSMFTNFIDTFLFRVNGVEEGVTFSIGETFVRLYDYLDYIGSGNKQTVIISFLFIFISFLYAIITNFKFLIKNKTSSLLFFIAFISPTFWYMIFINHTYIHCWFMLRFTTVSLIAMIVLTSIMVKSISIKKSPFLVSFLAFIKKRLVFLIIIISVLVALFFIKDFNSKKENKILEKIERLEKLENKNYLKVLNKEPVYKDSMYEIYLTQEKEVNKIIYLKRNTVSDKEIESKFFLHIYPEDRSILENGDNILGFDFKNNVRVIEKDKHRYFFSEAILPNIKIDAIHTGLYGYQGDGAVYWQISKLIKSNSFVKTIDLNQEPD